MLHVGDLAFCLGYELVICEQSQYYFILVILWFGVFEECGLRLSRCFTQVRFCVIDTDTHAVLRDHAHIASCSYNF